MDKGSLSSFRINKIVEQCLLDRYVKYNPLQVRKYASDYLILIYQ